MKQGVKISKWISKDWCPSCVDQKEFSCDYNTIWFSSKHRSMHEQIVLEERHMVSLCKYRIYNRGRKIFRSKLSENSANFPLVLQYFGWSIHPVNKCVKTSVCKISSSSGQSHEFIIFWKFCIINSPFYMTR